MASVYYPAIVERAKKGYSVFFPDLPGCASAGATLQEAARNAEEALAGHLIVSAQHGDAIPEPRALEAIERDPEVDEVARLLVRAELPGRAKRINIMLDESLIEAIDGISTNRSGFLAHAAQMALAAREKEKTMITWCFFGQDGMRALTSDESGSNLPPEFGPWNKFRIMPLSGADREDLAARQSIIEQGYWLFEKKAA